VFAGSVGSVLPQSSNDLRAERAVSDFDGWQPVEPLPADSPLYKMDNVLLSPHCADHTADWLQDAMKFFLQQLDRFRTGQPLENVVDMTRGS
jgi:phosphoglycerate dehydrogenase-like enzyme